MIKRRETALTFVLKGLIPYTRPNLLLSFRPNQFFNELEKISRYNTAQLRNAYNYAQRKKLITVHKERLPEISFAGRMHVEPFIAKKLGRQGRLMVIFDIPEEIKSKRDSFRRFLQRLEFTQIQQSVWMSRYDYKDFVQEAITVYELDDMVQLYEAARLT